ncbi:MAG: hypothetical protein J7J70_05205 [Deltaproteobacteria bacterium]|nr:hypothetical protein [Candidatus Tharpellaceae bacterium]
MNIIEKLDEKDKDKVSYFVQQLLYQSKYQSLKKEVVQRREEIQNGETLKHKEIWTR